MLAKEEQELISIFGERVAFHGIERMLYSSDLGALPELVKKQINTNPDAVVQPNSNDELRALVNLAIKYKSPLIPRGSGTAGYGGAIPTRGGIVADSCPEAEYKETLDKAKALLLAVSEQEGPVTTEVTEKHTGSGIRWKEHLST